VRNTDKPVNRIVDDFKFIRHTRNVELQIYNLVLSKRFEF
jgi:hypothetical protein